MSIKTPEQIATEIAAMPDNFGLTHQQTYEVALAAIRADRAQRSDFEKFGQFAYETLDGAEWSSDTLQALGEYASSVLNKPFRDPFDE